MDASTVSRREKSGGIREIMYHDEGEKTKEDGEEPFDYEYPCPAWTSAFAVKIVDCSCEEATKGTREGGGREEDGLTIH